MLNKLLQLFKKRSIITSIYFLKTRLSEVVIKQVPSTTFPPKITNKKHKNALITIQSLKRSTFSFFSFTVQSQSAHHAFTSAHVRAHRSQSSRLALTVRSQSVHFTFTVRLAFTYLSVRFHSFSFGTPKMKESFSAK